MPRLTPSGSRTVPRANNCLSGLYLAVPHGSHSALSRSTRILCGLSPCMPTHSLRYDFTMIEPDVVYTLKACATLTGPGHLRGSAWPAHRLARSGHQSARVLGAGLSSGAERCVTGITGVADGGGDPDYAHAARPHASPVCSPSPLHAEHGRELGVRTEPTKHGGSNSDQTPAGGDGWPRQTIIQR